MTYREIIDLGLSLGLEEIELYISESKKNVIKVFDGELMNYNVSDTFGMSVRGLYNGKMCYAYTESLEDKDIKMILNQLIQNAGTITSTEKENVFGGAENYAEVKDLKCDFTLHPLSEKIALLKRIAEKALSVDSRIIRVGYNVYQEVETTVKIINSKGLDLKRNYSFSFVVLGVQATDGKNNTVGYSQNIFTDFNKIDEERLVRECTKTALDSLGAGRVESGEYPVVLNREVASDLISSFKSVFLGTSALRKLTNLTDKVGEKVFGDNITFVDDPFCKDSVMQMAFDDEGVPCYTKNIVENGVFKGFMHSIKTAEAFGTKSTGNGFKAGIQGPVGTDASTFCLKEGNHTEDELIASVEKGVYISEITGLHAGVNPISGAFNVQSSGFLIENGKKTKPVTLFVLSGNFYEVFNNVEMIADNTDKPINGVGSPAILVKGLMISGS